MGGLAKICRIYGSMEMTDSKGNKVLWLWDYVNEKARLSTEMTKEEVTASEKEKLVKIKEQLSK